MPEENPPARVPEGRVSTGNAGLDAMLEGGLVPHRPYLLVGPAGTGKSRLSLQFLCEGVRRGERSLLVTLEEPPNEARVNHRGLAPELDSVDVFDAIPDVMRYERTPFKDIASVRAAVPFRRVPFEIRRTPELTSVEVTITALEQMLRSEVIRKNYTRLVIDSLTALQYFCMKGFDPIAGAQTFLRFLSDLQVTTILTVESPLEDADTPERMLARGEIRLFRWELEEQTVRAIGVEKFRGSPHDVRLHPYRIGPSGLDINLRVTISRDTRKIVEPEAPALPAAEPPPLALEPLEEAVQDLVVVGADLGALRTEIETALAATTKGDPDGAQLHLTGAWALTVSIAQSFRDRSGPASGPSPGADDALRRILGRSDSLRVGAPPGRLPMPPVLAAQLSRVLALIPPSPPAVEPELPAAPPGPSPVVAAAAAEPVPPPAVVPPAPGLPAEVPPEPTVPQGPAPQPEVPVPVPTPSPPGPAPELPPPLAPAVEATPPPPVVSAEPPPSPKRAAPPPREPVPSVAEFLTPRSHLNPEPPPLPARGLSGSRAGPPPAPPTPPPSGRASRTAPAPTPHPATPKAAAVAPTKLSEGVRAAPPPPPNLPPLPQESGLAPPSAGETAPEVPSPSAKRRRRTPAPKKKAGPGKAGAPGESTGSATAPSSGHLQAAPPPAPSIPAPGAIAADSPNSSPPPAPGPAASASPGAPTAKTAPETAKLKRRAPRKKKAPPVVAVTAGGPPQDSAEGTSSPGATAPATASEGPEPPKEAP